MNDDQNGLEQEPDDIQRAMEEAMEQAEGEPEPWPVEPPEIQQVVDEQPPAAKQADEPKFFRQHNPPGAKLRTVQAPEAPPAEPDAEGEVAEDEPQIPSPQQVVHFRAWARANQRRAQLGKPPEPFVPPEPTAEAIPLELPEDDPRWAPGRDPERWQGPPQQEHWFQGGDGGPDSTAEKLDKIIDLLTEIEEKLPTAARLG